jgi:hypothetical protein
MNLPATGREDNKVKCPGISTTYWKYDGFYGAIVQSRLSGSTFRVPD